MLFTSGELGLDLAKSLKLLDRCSDSCGEKAEMVRNNMDCRAEKANGPWESCSPLLCYLFYFILFHLSSCPSHIRDSGYLTVLSVRGVSSRWSCKPEVDEVARRPLFFCLLHPSVPLTRDGKHVCTDVPPPSEEEAVNQ